MYLQAILPCHTAMKCDMIEVSKNSMLDTAFARK